MKIKAAVVDKVNDPFIIKDDVELTDMQNNGLQVKIVASSICHSDERKGDAGFNLPAILGHDSSGIVEKVGNNVHNFEVGDHTIMSFYSCAECDNCLKGIPTQCRKYAASNLFGTRPDGR